MIKKLIEATSAQANFRPHAIILTSYSVPRPIFAAALIKADKFKRIDFMPNSNPLPYVKQVLDRLPDGVPCFGKTTGFVINYATDKALRFDKAGRPVSIVSSAYLVDEARLII